MGIIRTIDVVHETRSFAGTRVHVAVVVRNERPGHIRIAFNTVVGLLRGMRLTMSFFLSPKSIMTQQYPENRATLKITERFRGNLRFKFPNKEPQERHEALIKEIVHDTEVKESIVADWVRDDDDTRWYHNCTGCGKCESACPNASIKVVTRFGEVLQDNELDRFVWRMDSCMFCNACVQACPWDAIEMTPNFENAVYDRRLLVYNLNHLAGPRINLIMDEEKLDVRAQMIEHRDRYGGPVPLNGFALPNLVPVTQPNTSKPDAPDSDLRTSSR